jgi:VanZ family protein
MTIFDGRSARRGWLAAAVLYALLIAYGSLFPLTGWREPDDPWAWLGKLPALGQLPRADVVVNLLAYIPLGLSVAVVLRHGFGHSIAVLASTVIGFSLSLSVEYAQAYLPGRVSSVGDLVTNTVGSLAGALIAPLLGAQTTAGRRLARWRAQWVEPGRVADVGLIGFALWALSQLSPLVPSFDIGNLRNGVAPIVRTINGASPFSATQWLEYLCAVAAIALLLQRIVLPARPRLAATLFVVATVLTLKIPMIARQLSLEMVAGLAVGIALAAALARLRPQAVGVAGLALLVANIVVEGLAAGPTATMTAISWVPFRAHLANPLVGINVILEVSWSAFALAFFACAAGLLRKTLPSAALGTGLVGALVFGLEYAQQWIPGRVGDVTAPLVAALAFWAAWRLLPEPAAQATTPVSPDPARRRKGGTRSDRSRSDRRRWLEVTFGLGGMVALAGAVRWALSQPSPEGKGDRNLAPKLPAPHELTPVRFAAFQHAHPRLPHPSAEDLATLQRLNPGYLRQRSQQAKGGSGPAEVVALAELADPGSQDLEQLARRLLALKLDWRGHAQGKAIAVGYDWLYDRWSPPQREALRNKLVEAANYLVHYIREERLSPYNVYLYNAPFQALVACAIALYGDDPRGDAVMAFTADLWKNRVLPVWRQVMGRQGGWHEGGEYVGIGIGEAVYQVPAMWRAATGEDLFAAEPGIRGFLDFMIQRTLPNGSHFRWGDGAHFDRNVFDTLPLAIEYRHAAAYTMRAPKLVVPTAWPWGPLSDDSLRDPAALSRQPLSTLFDGIGMLVARNRWGPDATHVSFKAGDNYWSHVHLDQGAYAIYRGAPLAIDSGYYNEYGSDHHLNYHYQTIAHNTITVTDPEDDVPAPAIKDTDKPRPIANDGGQRRVGSGWGVERAPLDLAEWSAKRAIYHTGAIVAHVDADGISAALADITPAYTNELSGRRSFSHRTRRVERCWRFFAYDRIDDFVVVYDDVRATRATFRKRWLLHSVNEPRIGNDSFVVSMPPQPELERAGGELEGRVLLPRHAMLNPIGGPGLEFYVDGRNFDEGGKLTAALAKREKNPARPEPGAWRIELSPQTDALDDQFLVVMFIGAYGAARLHRVRLVERGDQVGAEIVGATRTTRWWFTPGQLAAHVEVDTRTFELRPRS